MMFRHWTKRINQTRQKTYRRVNRWSHGGVEIIVNTFQSFYDQRVLQISASLGYYTIFSIFPLLLTLIIVASYFVDQAEVQSLVTEWVMEFFPYATDFIAENINFVFENSNIAGIIAVVGLVWSATTVFYMLVYNINLAWSRSKASQPIKNRIVALIMIAILLGLLVFSTTFNTVVDLINNLLPFLNLLQTPFWNYLLIILPFALRFMAYFSLYKWVPDVKVRNVSATIASLLAMTMLEFSSYGFRWTLQTGLVRYQVVYGTLGTIMTLMLWIYINFVLIFFFAHLTASIEKYLNNRSRGRESLHLQTYPHPLRNNHD